MKRALIVILGIGLALFVAYQSVTKDRTIWHQKLTLTIETPAGEVSGSTVVKVTWTGRGKLILRDLDPGLLSLTRGEAAVIEVLPGRYLFALLDGQERYVYARLSNGRGVEETLPDIRRQRAPLVLSPEPFGLMNAVYFPTFVTFDDIADPKTVQKVDPADLAASFGPGVRLKAVTVEVTRDAVTEGRVDKLLGWLGPYPETPLLPNIEPTDFSFQALLRQGSFISRE